MMTAKEIEQTLQKDLLNFYNRPYEGELPDNLIDLFKQAVFHAAPAAHQIHTIKIIQIFNKTEAELLFGEVGMIFKVITETPPFRMFDTPEEFLSTYEILEKVYIEYNAEVAEFGRRQAVKRNTLSRIGNVGNNGMRISRN